MNYGQLTVIFENKVQAQYEVKYSSPSKNSVYLSCRRLDGSDRHVDKEQPEIFQLKNIDLVELTKAFRANRGYLIVNHHMENLLGDDDDERGDITIDREHNDMSWLPQKTH